MPRTRKPHRDRVVAAGVALVVNGVLLWQLQALVATRVTADAGTPLQVVMIAAVPPRRAAIIEPTRHPRAKAPSPRTLARPSNVLPAPATALALPEASAEIVPARPMSAVYLQQARQWSQQQAPVNLVSARRGPLAERVVDLPESSPTRFRVAEPMSVAIVVDRIGQAFGNGPHPCIRNREDVAAYATGGDALALEMALDTERRCRP